MPSHSHSSTPPARDAATVVLLRDGHQGLEVFLIKRHEKSEVMANTYVFPGGKLDAADLQVDWLLDQSPAALHQSLGEADLPLAHAQGLFVAAIRETFEECGVLFTDPTHLAQAAQHKDDAPPFKQLVDGLSIILQTRQLQPWARWITPLNPLLSSKRFDARFFVAAVPTGQTALHDNFEASHSAWLAPRQALDLYWQRSIILAPPQIMSLVQLARHPTVHSVLQEARLRPPPLILPEAHEERGERFICYPGDPQHSNSELALPGPTRLYLRQQRFEPAGGFQDWLC
jgi:8-oxo-dGTP pyrophosphatase MutT (NUDIX family)